MLGEFFHWWGQQLHSLIPPRLRAWGGAADMLVADATQAPLLVLTRRRGTTEQRLAQCRLDEEAGLTRLRATLTARPASQRLILRLPPHLVLERSVTLPVAAERDLDRVLGYEMERLTPFTAEEVFWGAHLQERDKARARLIIRLMVVPRASIASLIETLARQGASPDLLETTSQAPIIRLAHNRTAEGGLLCARNLLAASALLLAAVLASPFLRQSLQLAELSARLQTMAPRLAQAEALRQRIAGAGAGGDAVAAETRRLGDALQALAVITNVLPDDSYLTEFTMRERKITLSGLATSAPKLISSLSADPHIRNPAFTAPVTRSETNHLDVFSIRAELAAQGNAP